MGQLREPSRATQIGQIRNKLKHFRDCRRGESGNGNGKGNGIVVEFNYSICLLWPDFNCEQLKRVTLESKTNNVNITNDSLVVDRFEEVEVRGKSRLFLYGLCSGLMAYKSGCKEKNSSYSSYSTRYGLVRF